MDLSKLTKEEKDSLRCELVAEQKATELRIQQERETYKQLVDKFVSSNLFKLQNLSSQMMRIKQEVFADADTLVKMKDELYRTKSDRKSDTFTTTDGTCSITMGNRINEGWDDTVNSGIEKVKEYLKTLARDDNSAMLVDTVMGLLAKDRKGALKASKVLELEKLAIKMQDKEFLDGISIIKAAYRNIPSVSFIEVNMKDDKGNELKLPLSLSAMK